MFVCGPPGSGKTTYVAERAKRGDLIIDLDDLWEALTGLGRFDESEILLPYIHEARNAVLKRWGAYRNCDIWFIHCAAWRDKRRAARRMFDADVVILEVSPNECVRRSEGRGSDRVKLFDMATAWWREYQKYPNDPEETVIKES